MLLSAMSALSAFASDQIFIVHKGRSVIYTNRPTSKDSIVGEWRPSAQKIWVSYRSPAGRGQLSKKYHDLIVSVARETGLDPSLVKAVVHAESAFNPRARSKKGAMGLMQLMPFTAREVGVRNPYEPADNLRGGASYLRQLMERYSGNVGLSLAAYNAGPGAVDNYGGIPPYTETRNYVKRVIALQRAYHSKQS